MIRTTERERRDSDPRAGGGSSAKPNAATPLGCRGGSSRSHEPRKVLGERPRRNALVGSRLSTAPVSSSLERMRCVPGGTFAMGSEDFYPEERPVHRVAVDGFWMDEHPVTAAEFRRFVRETGYVTVAERPLDPARVPRRRSRPARARARSSSARPRARSTSTTTATGGSTCRARAGSGRAARARRSTAATGTGRARRLRGRRGVRGLGRQGAADRGGVGVRRARRARGRRRSPGATSTSRTARRWRTPGRASSRGRT